MAIRYNEIQCCRCDKWKKRRHEIIKDQKSYLCRSCRNAVLARNKLHTIISNSVPFRKVQYKISKEITSLCHLPEQERQQQVIQNLDAILIPNNIRDYKFKLVDNKLIAITALNIPFIGNIEIPVLTNEKRKRKYYRKSQKQGAPEGIPKWGEYH